MELRGWQNGAPEAPTSRAGFGALPGPSFDLEAFGDASWSGSGLPPGRPKIIGSAPGASWRKKLIGFSLPGAPRGSPSGSPRASEGAFGNSFARLLLKSVFSLTLVFHEATMDFQGLGGLRGAKILPRRLQHQAPEA